MYAAGATRCHGAGTARCGPACTTGLDWLRPQASQQGAGSYSLCQGVLGCRTILVVYMRHISAIQTRPDLCWQAPAGSTLSATCVEQIVQAACIQACSLSSDVTPHVLTYNATEAVQVLSVCCSGLLTIPAALSVACVLSCC